jgi:hypothetical protein
MKGMIKNRTTDPLDFVFLGFIPCIPFIPVKMNLVSYGFVVGMLRPEIGLS